MKKVFLHSIFLFFLLHTTSLSQNNDEFSEFLEELDAIIEENQESQPSSSDDYEYDDYATPKQQEAQEEYLKTPIEKKAIRLNLLK